MSEGDDKEGDTALTDVLSAAEACKEVNQEELLNRVRKMNEELEATRIPLHHVPVAVVVENITREKIARRALTWEGEFPRSRYRGDLFKPPLFDDEPSDSDDDESRQGSSLAAIRK
eukprot:g12692.t1